MSFEPEADLRWSAFLYITGEMELEEAIAFERLLGDDQTAREAVAEAVEMAGALVSLRPDRVRSLPRRRPTRRVAWVLSLASAACLAMAIVPMFRADQPSRPVASDVAEAWSDLRGESDIDWVSSVAEPPVLEGTEPPSSGEADDSSERALPSWLLTAAAATRDATPPREEN